MNLPQMPYYCKADVMGSTFSVQPIEYAKAMEWCLTKHYARRKPMFQFSFALVDQNDNVQGIVVYGRPPVQIEKSVFLEAINAPYKIGRAHV